MDLNLVVSTVAMIATVVSTIIAITQVKKCKEIKAEIITIKSETYNMVENSKKNNETISNEGTNSGVIAKDIRGGVKIGK